jgi:branched-chain amino acid transport system substrate-binding protein
VLQIQYDYARRSKIMKFRIMFAALLALALVLGACTPAATPAPAEPAEPAPAEPAATEAPAEPVAGEPIKIAILSPLSGAVPTFGVSNRDGALLAIKEWNEKGGVLGRPIEAIVEDSQCSADPAVNAANKVIGQDGVKFIVGEVCSSASIPVSEITEEKGIVQISGTSTNAQVTLNLDGTTKEYVFRACFIDPFQGKVGAAFALKQGYKTAFIMYDQGNDYVLGLAENFEAAFTAGGGTIVGKESYTGTDTDFSATLTKVAEANPDVLYVPDYYNIINLVGAQAKEKGVTAVMMGGDGWDSADLDRAAAEGGYYTNHYSDQDTRPIVQNWVANYQAEYGAVPDALATLAYDATNLLLNAIDTAGTADDTAAVAAALAASNWEGVSGQITFDAQHNPIKAAVVLQVKDGNIEYVDTVAP